jgi:TonB-dependent starch-binding outer membrane protein SusC
MKKKCIWHTEPFPCFTKTWKIMRLSVFFLFVIVAQSWALDSYSQVTRLSLDMKDARVIDVLGEIENKTEFFFLFNQKLLDVERRVDIEVRQRKIEDILNELFAGTNVNYLVMNRQIVLTTAQPGSEEFKQQTAGQQQGQVTGKVTDHTGAPLPGVTVVIKGTTTGTITGNNGSYSLSIVPPNATLVFSFMGMRTQEIVVGSQTEIDVTMIVDAVDIEEVVAVGYGIQKKINLTGSISTIKFDEKIDNRPITNASQALAGNATGVWVTQLSGRPGSDGAQIRIRGWGTLNNSDPLILIDGVQGAISQINPNDIETITVLKDAASSSIYGSRAANGVVLITLKSGNYKDEIRVNIGSYAGVQSLGRRYDLIDNSVEYMNMWNQALANRGGSKLFSDDLINEFKNGNDPYKYPNTNFFDEVFETATITEHNLSINGGSQKSKYFMSFNYLNQDGIIRKTDSERYGLTLNLESKIKDWLTVGGRLNGMKKVSKGPYDLWNMMQRFQNGAYPFIAPYTRDGRLGAVQALRSDGRPIVENRSPLTFLHSGKSIDENNFLKMNAFVDIKFTDYLTLKSNFTSQHSGNLNDRYYVNIVSNYTDAGLEVQRNTVFPLESSRYNSQSTYNNLFTTLNFDKDFGQAHNVSAIVGMQTESTIIKDVSGRKSNPPKEGLTQIDAGTAGITASGNMYGLRMLSYFGRANYVYLDKYLFEMNVRADASSRFKEGYRWGVFPAFSTGWRLSEENFIKDLDVFSNLKLRASWGKLGNQNIGSYWPYLTVISQNNSVSYNFGGSFAPGAAVTSLVEETISWETTTTTNVGIEFGFFNNQLSVETDFFRKVTDDIIVQLPIPSLLGGVSAPFENVGKMENNGFEFIINYSKVASNKNELGYKLGVNLTYVENEVTKFRKDAPDQLYLIREGYPYRVLYGLKAIGIYQTNQEAIEHMHSNGYKPQAGELKYEDINNDGKIGFEDMTVLGNTIPRFTFGITPSFTYKGFDLSLLFHGIADVSVYTQNNWTQPLGISGGTITKRWRDAWTPENTKTDIPRITINDTWRSQASSFWVSNLSFIKLQNIQLGYALPNNVTSHLGLQKLYFYVNAQNVGSLVSKDYEGFDPERNTFDSGSHNYPIPRIISIGVNIQL